MKTKLAVIIPARNESKVIKACLEKLLKIVDKRHVYLVDDASSDKTAKIAKSFIRNVLVQPQNLGKAQAINAAIKHYNLIKKYELIFPLDADTEVESNFIENILKTFKKDKQKKIAAIIGKVKTSSTSVTSSYRLWEYEISQLIHKKAQSALGGIIVCSGCATVYRSQIFKSVKFESETLTEDMDLTFKIHRLHLGKIVFTDESIAQTQDPQSLGDFGKQIERWYTGFWQCVAKHKIPFGRQMLDFEVGISALEGLINTLLIVALLLALPVLLIKTPQLLLLVLVADLLLFLLPTLIFCAFKYKAWKILTLIPAFYFLRIFSSMIFMAAFLKTAFSMDNKTGWNKAERYINS